MLVIIFNISSGSIFTSWQKKFNKNKRLFAILGVLVCYAGMFIGEVLLGILDDLIGIDFDGDNYMSLSLIGSPFGNGAANIEDEIQDIGKKLE